MNTVYAGGVSQDGISLIRSYLTKFMPDAVIEELPTIGIKGKIRNKGKEPDVVLIILDETMYQNCVGAADYVLSLSKVHKYEDDDSLRHFLESKFGLLDLDSVVAESSDHSDSTSSDDDVSKSELLKLNSLIKSKDLTISNLRGRIKDLSLDDVDYNVLYDKIELLELEAKNYSTGKGKVTTNEVLVSSLETRVANIQLELDELNSSYAKLKDENVALKLSSSSSMNEKDIIEMNSLKTKILSLEDELKSSESIIISLKEQVKSLEDIRIELSSKTIDLESSNGLKGELEGKISDLKIALESMTGIKNTYEKDLSDSSSELCKLKDSLQSSENIVKTLTEELSKASSAHKETTELSVELSKAKDINESLLKKVDSLELRVNENLSSISDLELKLRDSSSLSEEKSQSLSDLDALVKKLENEILILNEKDYDGLLERFDSISERNKSAEDSLSILRKDYAIMTVDLENHKEKLKVLEENKVSLEDYLKLQKVCNSQKGDIDELQDFLDEIKLSPFFMMNNYASPKVAMQLSLDLSLSLRKSKLVLLSTGSGESSATMYQIIKERCSKSSKNYLLVDLVTESFIDSSVGLLDNKPPHSWLSGGDSSVCVCDTKLDNVTAITSAIGYINELSFLNVDWASRLTSLDGLSDIILLNIGCIDSVVRQCLFNTFIGVCDSSNIFVKATPTNLRTTINHLGSIVSLGDSTVVCTDTTDTTVSNALYNKLSSKCTSIIYSEDVHLDW